jgi:hypothetical protein
LKILMFKMDIYPGFGFDIALRIHIENMLTMVSFSIKILRLE